MGEPKKASDNVAERFLDYLYEERQGEVARLNRADRERLEASKRIRQLDREIIAIKGGAL